MTERHHRGGAVPDRPDGVAEPEQETPLQRAVVAVILVCVIVLAIAATIAGVRALL